MTSNNSSEKTQTTDRYTKRIRSFKKRHSVEIARSFFKKYNRLMVRRDMNIQIILDRFMGLIDIF